MLRYLFNFIIFPGFLFTVIFGLIASWIDRKLTARIQWRVGPRWYQPFMDLVKLSMKEIMVPANASKPLFFISPLLGFSAVILTSTFIWLANMNFGASGFTGDIIVIVYLLTLPSLAVILGGSASANPLASLGVSREIKLMLAYELPFILSLSVPIIKSSGLLRMGDIIAYQAINGPFILSISGALAIFVAVFCAQAKLGYVPFDMAEAETEIMAGVSIEYSGILLAIFKLTKMMMVVALPVFLITIFWGGFGILKYAVIFIIIILIKNTNPRVRIDQAVRFFWGKMSILALMAVLFAVMGL